jgi:hypothetical protein
LAIPTAKSSERGLPSKYVRDVYFTEDPTPAAVLLDRVIAGRLIAEVDEIALSITP